MKATPAILLITATLTLTACSMADETPGAVESAAASTVPTSSPSPSDTDTSTTPPTDVATPPPPPTSPDSPAPSPSNSLKDEDQQPPDGQDQESDAPTVPTDKAGVTLGLTDFFEPSDSWEESRYEVAAEVNVSGIAVNVNSFSQMQPDYLELRLANNFEKLNFTVGQSNDSESSSQTMVVQVLGNDKQLDIQKVPFNAQQPISVNVAGVNAVIINVYLDDSDDNRGVKAVLSDITVQ